MAGIKADRRARYRINARVSVDMDGKIGHAKETFPVVIENFSKRGVGIRTAAKVPTVNECVLVIENIEISCWIIWSKFNRSGLKFKRALTEDQANYLQMLANNASSVASMQPSKFWRAARWLLARWRERPRG
jgi:hypothetical protein